MPRAPIVYKTFQRFQFSDLDPCNHMGTAKYVAHFVDHRMSGLRENIGWDLNALATLPFMMWVRRIEVDFIPPARGDQEVTITSYVREFKGSDALIPCSMADAAGRELSR